MLEITRSAGEILTFHMNQTNSEEIILLGFTDVKKYHNTGVIEDITEQS